ncbi:MAG: SDR family oxidoreductase, partial [Rhodospirillaceae bacterium]|nr:SDR family oxidoreductase [Rhodospirillaceae bacterium]
MAGKRGLIMGVANRNSIAWGIARTLSQHGADLAFTYQGEALERRVRPLAETVQSDLVMPCDVEDGGSVDAVFDGLRTAWGGLDFVVHAIAYSDKEELKGRYVDTSRDNFLRTLDVSCYSFTAIAQRAAAILLRRDALHKLTVAAPQLCRFAGFLG